MTAPVPRIPKWPFFLGDALLLALAWLISRQSAAPAGALEICVYVACVALGAWLSILPFLKDYQAELKFAEADRLVSVTSQIQNLEQLSSQIGYATGQWQTIREAADRTAATAKSIADGMAAEVKAFNEFIAKTNDSEKSALRLEVDKLRRGEVQWLQVLVRILDHVFAVHQAAVRSRQAGVAEQLSKFQAACLDSARRIGLVPFVAAQGEPFDPEKHQLIEGADAKASAGAEVSDTLAAGYSFQGRLIRPAMVRLKNSESSETDPDSSNVSQTETLEDAEPEQEQESPAPEETETSETHPAAEVLEEQVTDEPASNTEEPEVSADANTAEIESPETPDLAAEAEPAPSPEPERKPRPNPEQSHLF